MSRHVTFRGTTIDMDSIRRENEKVTAIGNMPVNARGDQIKGGKIIRTADDLARDSHSIKTAIVSTGLKGRMPPEPVKQIAPAPVPAKPVPKKTKEVELPSGDIIMKEEDENKST